MEELHIIETVLPSKEIPFDFQGLKDRMTAKASDQLFKIVLDGEAHVVQLIQHEPQSVSLIASIGILNDWEIQVSTLAEIIANIKFNYEMQIMNLQQHLQKNGDALLACAKGGAR